MMRKNGIVATAAVISLLASTAVAVAAPVDDARIRGLAWLIKNQNGDGSWGSSPNIRPQATLAALQAFDAAKIRRASFPRGSGWLLNAQVDSVDSLSQQLGGLKIVGMDVSAVGGRIKTLVNYRAQWGTYQRHESGQIDTSLALTSILGSGTSILLNQDPNAISTPSIAATFCAVGGMQLASGLWPAASYSTNQQPPASTGASNGQVLATIHAIRFFRAVRTYLSSDVGLNCTRSGSTYSVSTATAISNAITGLVNTKRQPDGGFGDNGTSTVLETALTYDVLRQERPNDASTTAALNYLIGRQNTTAGTGYGSWNSDALATALVLRALPALTAPMIDTDADGLPDVIETVLGTNPNVADSIGLSGSNGASVAGLTTSITLPGAALNQAYSVALSTLGAGSGWQLLGGQLPDGMTLSSGNVTGTGTRSGTFSFLYDYLPSGASDRRQVLAKITVSTAGSSSMMAMSSSSAPATQTSSSTTSNSTASTTTPYLAVSLAGSSAQMQRLHIALQSLFQPTTLETYFDDGGVAGARTGLAMRAYRGTLTGTGTDLDGRMAIVQVSTLGDSAVASQAVGRSVGLEQLALGACNNPYRDHLWSCPFGQRQAMVPDIAMLDIDPAWSSAELSSLSTLADWLRLALNANERSALSTIALGSVRFGVAVSNNVPVTALSSSAVATLLRGQANQWSSLSSQASGTVVRCGNTAGSGAQISAKTGLAVGCSIDSSSVTPLAASGNATSECLNQAFAQGQLAIGMLSTEQRPASSDNWRFISIDGLTTAAANYGWPAPAPRLLWRTESSASTDVRARLLVWLRQRLAISSASATPLPNAGSRCSTP